MPTLRFGLHRRRTFAASAVRLLTRLCGPLPDGARPPVG